MNTPGHVVVNLLSLGRRNRTSLFLPIAIGAMVPDLPMFLFYAYEKLWLDTPENVIWTDSYNHIGWQMFFDIFNSLPLLVVAFLLARRASAPRAAAAFASMMLHSVCDLFLHESDAHRHFFPLSDWRFRSPVSYWDPNRYGGIAFGLEVLVVVVGAVVLSRRYRTSGERLVLGLTLASYAIYIAYGFIVWY